MNDTELKTITIKNLEGKGEFILGGKAFWLKNPYSKIERESLRMKINENATGNKYKLEKEESKMKYKSRYIEEALGGVEERNPGSKEEISNSVQEIKEKILPGDNIIFFNSPAIFSKNLHSVKTNSIIYIEIEQNLSIGWVIDKELLAFTSGGVLSGE